MRHAATAHTHTQAVALCRAVSESEATADAASVIEADAKEGKGVNTMFGRPAETNENVALAARKSSCNNQFCGTPGAALQLCSPRSSVCGGFFYDCSYSLSSGAIFFFGENMCGATCAHVILLQQLALVLCVLCHGAHAFLLSASAAHRVSG